MGERSGRESVRAAESPAQEVEGGERVLVMRQIAAGRARRRRNGAEAGAEAAGSGGSPLPPAQQSRFEASLGTDLSGVRVHTGAASAESADQLDAQAYTVGSDIHFGASAYQPESAEGEKLLAHEVAHTAQQSGAPRRKPKVSEPGDACEREADQAAEAMTSGRPARVSPASGIQRKDKDEKEDDQTGAVQATIDDTPLPDLTKNPDLGTFTAYANALQQVLEGLAALKPRSEEAAALIEKYVIAAAPPLIDRVKTLQKDIIDQTNDSSLAKQAPGPQPALPTIDQAQAFSSSAAALSKARRDLRMPVEEDWMQGLSFLDKLDKVSAVTTDAALAILQAMSVASARDRWKDNLAKGDPAKSDELHEVLGQGGWDDPDQEWCGIFTAANFSRGARLDEKLRRGLFHTENSKDFFNYTAKTNPTRAPQAIWAEGQWWNLRDYHEQRGSLRQWTSRELLEALNGVPTDIRPGDVALIDQGTGDAGHITMIESYDPEKGQIVTVEGNIFGGVVAGADGKVGRKQGDEEHIDPGNVPGTAHTGLNVRDLRHMEGGMKPHGGYMEVSGHSVFGIGRHSLVDFENHDYAEMPIPEGLRKFSPDQILELTKEKASQEKDRQKLEQQAKTVTPVK